VNAAERREAPLYRPAAPGATLLPQEVRGARVGGKLHDARARRRSRGRALVPARDTLDVIVELDGSWRWKDEDELAVFVERGVFDRALAERVRDERLGVVRRAARHEPPFDATWRGWRPDPRWPHPELADGWDEWCR
jgi:hypothetical protein